MILGIVASSIAKGLTLAEIYEQDNAASISTEVDSIGNWLSNSSPAWATGTSVGSGTTTPYNGSYCLMAYYSGAGTFTYIQYSFSTVEGEVYDISLYAKKGLGAADEQNIRVTGVNGASNEQLVTTSSWAEYTWSLTATSTGTGYIQVMTSQETSEEASVFVDAVSIKIEALLEFDATLTTPSAGTLTNVTGTSWTVDRDSVATYKNDSGVLTTVAVDVPRIQDDKVLIESAATNEFTYSKDLTQWPSDNITVALAAGNSPAGSVDSYEITDDTTDGFHRLKSNLISVTSSDVFTMSVFAKESVLSEVNLKFYDGSTNHAALFNLSNGTVTTELNVTNSSIILQNNGWYKCSMTGTVSNTLATSQPLIYVTDGTGQDGNGNISYAGADEELLLYGASFTKSALSSYIETTGTVATREADVITNTVPIGASSMETWINGVSDGGIQVIQGSTITMENGTTKIIITGNKPANELHEADNAASLYGEELDDIGSWFGTNIPNGGTFTSVSTTSDNGDYCLELVTGATRSQCQANYDFPITDTDTYSVSVRAKRGQGTNQMITGWTNVTGTGVVPITSTSWETYTFNVTATATGDCRIKIFAEQANGATGDSVYIDSVTIIKTS